MKMTTSKQPLVQMTAALRVALIACWLSGVAAGCGPRYGTVSGQVTYKHKPVTAGLVSFIPSNGVPITVEIQSDGRYEAPNVLYGDAYVIVLDKQENESVTEAQKERRKKWLQEGADPSTPPPPLPAANKVPRPILPKKYAEAETSNLRCKVDSARVTFDIVLVD